MMADLKSGECKMKFLKSSCGIIFTAVTALLIVALAFSVFGIADKSREIKDIKSKAQNTISSEAEKYKSELEEKQKQNEKIQAELEAERAEKKRLQEENSSLNKKIQELSDKKTAERKAAAEALSRQSKTPAKGKVCYLTFDDGPSDNTLKILDILKKYNVKATFFVINSPRIQYIKQISDEGHTVALHTATHNYKTIYSSKEAYFKDLQSISDTVERILGKKITMMRFPGGSSNYVSKEYCKGIMSELVLSVTEKGYSYFDWNVSSGDAVSDTPSYTYIRNSVLNGAKDKNTICVLMHDSAPKTTTVQALPEIITGLKNMGYSFDYLKDESFGYHHHISN